MQRNKDTTESAEPTPLSDALEQSPIAEIPASRDPEPDQPTSMEAVAAEVLAASKKKTTHVQRLAGLRPTPKGFLGFEGHYNAGIRLSRSLDKRTVAIQLTDDRRPSRDGLILTAVARKLLVIANAVIRTGLPWDPTQAMAR